MGREFLRTSTRKGLDLPDQSLPVAPLVGLHNGTHDHNRPLELESHAWWPVHKVEVYAWQIA